MIIDTIQSKVYTIDFETGKESGIHYPKAKLIDMFGFSLSQ